MGSVRPGGTFGSSLAMVALLMMPSPSEPNYINEVVLDGDAFLRVGLNSAVVRVAPAGAPMDGCAQRVDYVIYEETQGQEPENRLMVGEDTYAVGEEVELEAGVHGFVFMLVCEKSVRCVPSVSVNDINVGITGNGSLGGGWRAFSGRLEAQEPASGELTFLIIGDDMSMEYAFPLRIRKEGGGGGTDVEVMFERNGAVVFRPEEFSVNCRISVVDDEAAIEADVDGKSAAYTPLGDGNIRITVPTEGLDYGKHVVGVRVLSRTGGNVLAAGGCTFTLCGLETVLYERTSGEQNSGYNMRIGEGLTYVLEADLLAEAGLGATLTNRRTGQTMDGYPAADGRRILFYLRDQDVGRGPHELVIALRGDGVDESRSVTVTGWHVYTCTYSVGNGAVYAQLAGPTAALEFPVHLSVAVYLQGVIPYTEAIEVAGGHYDRECYEYVDVESIGMAFDVAAGETFAKREIYSSSYFRYIPDYLSKELKKISAAHTSTRWVEENGTWRKETYRPVPYLLAKIVYGDMRKSGGAYPDYFEIVYNDKQVRTFLGGYGVKVKSYVAAK